MSDPTPGNDPDSRDSSYELYRRGMDLLEEGDFAAAAVSLGKLASIEPSKTSVREAHGRALFRCRRYRAAAEEFAAVVEHYPVNDYAHFCLGRALTLSGDRVRGRRHLALACNLRPDRSEYRMYSPPTPPGVE